MMFFAANSLLARLALRSGQIDGASFTAIRIAAGAATLVLLTSFRRQGIGAAKRYGSLRAALALFTYAITFSFGYLSMDAGTGALVLFAAVEITMLGAGIARGERPRPLEWTGLAMAFGGLVYLVTPGTSAPSPVGFSLMAVSGAAWGHYSLAARDAGSPIAATAGNFTRAIPLAAGALLLVWEFGRLHASWPGAGLAMTSGAVTSGLAYALWYAALKDLRSSIAAIVQLTVPAIAAAAGVVLLGEHLTWRLALASGVILGGVALALLGRGGERTV
jgi:drug/metabolite transporter (DMT)-like permease